MFKQFQINVKRFVTSVKGFLDNMIFFHYKLQSKMKARMVKRIDH